ncbi:MAG: AraC family transcriptional regulator [Nevskiaceae bacterium]|nr:MAG: AraC family transcriptional regulator [Nevskiaceae bacterium]TAM23014.1 MAG: AraC family transcriptional regulator [Nevskiaceae bacterium]
MTADASPPTTVALGYLRALFDYLRLHNLEAEVVLDGRRLDFDDREARIPEPEAAALFNRAARLLGDADLGLHVGEQIRPGHYGVLGYVAMACDTLGEALACQQRYQALVLSLPPMRMSPESEGVLLCWQSVPDASYRQLAEFNLSALLSFVRWITGRPLMPLRLDLIYPEPADTREQRRLFGCPLRFNQSEYRLLIPTTWAGLPLIQPDPTMRALMDRLAERQLQQLAPADDPVARARAQIARQLSEGVPELGGVAARLQLSPRSLQRLLQEQGLSYSQLVEAVRRELAERYLAEPGLDLTDLAFLLGYSEQSAFQRAYKRWTGRTPGEYRRQLAGG